MDTLLKIVGNTALISVHEEIFITMIIYFFSNKQLLNVLDFTEYRENKALILIPSIVSALISNMVRYIGFQSTMLGFLAPIVLLVLTLYINIKYNYSNNSIYTIIWQTMKGFITAFFITLSINLLIFNIINKSMNELNNNIIINFIYCLPCIIAQYLVLFIITQRYNKKINIISLIYKNKTCKNILNILITVLTILMIIYLKLAIYDQMFIHLEIIPMILTLFLLIIGLMAFRIYKINYNIKMKSFDCT